MTTTYRTDTEPSVLAEFEQDRVARLHAHYAERRANGTDALSLVTGSIGGTRIPEPDSFFYATQRGSSALPVDGPVTVNRGAW